MKIDEILKLKDAGFTSEEIANLGNLLDKEQPEAQTPEPKDYSEDFKQLRESIIAEMKNIFITSGSSGEGQSGQESVDDILKNHFGGK